MEDGRGVGMLFFSILSLFYKNCFNHILEGGTPPLNQIFIFRSDPPSPPPFFFSFFAQSAFCVKTEMETGSEAICMEVWSERDLSNYSGLRTSAIASNDTYDEKDQSTWIIGDVRVNLTNKTSLASTFPSRHAGFSHTKHPLPSLGATG